MPSIEMSDLQGGRASVHCFLNSPEVRLGLDFPVSQVGMCETIRSFGRVLCM